MALEIHTSAGRPNAKISLDHRLETEPWTAMVKLLGMNVACSSSVFVGTRGLAYSPEMSDGEEGSGREHTDPMFCFDTDVDFNHGTTHNP